MEQSSKKRKNRRRSKGWSSKKRKVKQQPGDHARDCAVWLENDKLELHAYLDYGKYARLSPVEILDGFSQYHQRQHDRWFDPDRVERQLLSLFLYPHPRRDGLTKKDFHLVWEHGSGIITYFKDEFKQAEIPRRFERIKAEKQKELIHSPRKLRTSRTPGASDRGRASTQPRYNSVARQAGDGHASQSATANYSYTEESTAAAGQEASQHSEVMSTYSHHLGNVP